MKDYYTMMKELHSMEADIKLGYSCNNNCIHCVAADARELCSLRGKSIDLTTAEYKHELQDSRSRGCDSITFTGGEPTVRNDLPCLMHFASNLGYSINMQTNGRRFCSLQYAEALSRIARASYCIALHGSNAKTHDAVTRVRGSFNETVTGIKNLVSLNQNVLAKLVLSQTNHLFQKDICVLLGDLGVRHITITFPHGLGNAGKNFIDVIPHYGQTVDQLHSSLDYCREKNIVIRTEAYPYCFMEGYEEHVTELYFNEEPVELKQLGHRNFLIDWSKVRPTEKKKFHQCVECRYECICEGPWREYPEKYGENEFKPISGEKFKTRQELMEKTALRGESKPSAQQI
ncbi:MAG: radical SAM protein [Vulcanimicrobiota bacterium]